MAETEQTPEAEDAQGLLDALDESIDAAGETPETPEQPEQPAEEGQAAAGEQPETAAGEQPEQPEAVAGDTPETPETPEPLAAPEHWSAEHREMFGKLDRDAQSFLMDRSREMEAAHTQRSQEIAPFRAAAEQWSPYLQSVGATPDRAFNSLMQLEYGLRTGTIPPAEDAIALSNR